MRAGRTADLLAQMASDDHIGYLPTGGTFKDARGRVWHEMLAAYRGRSNGWVYWLRRSQGSYAGAHATGPDSSPQGTTLL